MGVVAVCAGLFLLAILISAVAQRSQARVTRSARRAGHERPARQGLHPAPAPGPRLLHRGEGGRDHDPHDQRHREPAAAAAGRARSAGRAGADDGRDHRDPVHAERRADADHACAGDPDPDRAHDLVHARLTAWLRAGARRDRGRARRPLGEPPWRADGRRLQPPALERRPAPQRRRGLPRRQQLHRADQRDLRSGHADARLPRPGGAARDRRQHGAARPALDRRSWSRSSCT